MAVQRVERSQIRSLNDYEIARATWRPKIMALKDRRRVRVGDGLTFLFENHETVLYQIQEMLRVERLSKPEEIAHEVDTYNELIPGPHELSASLLIEYETPELRAVWLTALLGLENHVWIAVGDTPRVKARFDDRQISIDRISSVQYVKWQLSPEQARLFRGGAKIVIDHPKYQAETAFAADQLQTLGEDLA